MEAIEKINAEMQKDPSNGYMEILGHYLIDRCSDPRDETLIGADGKTLKGAMDKVMEEAKKNKHGSVAVLSDTEVFRIVDQYFGLKTDIKAQRSALPMTEEKVEAPSVTLDLADFL